ncbi:MAG: histidinol-phosphatase HisJ family protein [Coriobacteriia bacterium]|nr:histidinol-phosphatase HisJ family protein [Coriobacteriia bacterium]
MTCFDAHTHTYLSNHGIGTVAEVVATAAERGLSLVALTEHLPLPPEVDRNGTFAMDEDKVDDYFAAIEAAREAYPEIEIVQGMEIDWRAGAEDYLLSKLAALPRPLELLLGSVHMLTDAEGNHWEFDHPAYIDGWHERGEEQVWAQYLMLWIEAVNSAVPFDVMTHPDLPKKLGFKPAFDTREYYAAMAEAAAKRDVMVEVNVSGLRKPVEEIYPASTLLKAFYEAGVSCTIGSDAHDPYDVALFFDRGCTLLRAAGYTEVIMPLRSGDRKPILIEDFEVSWRKGQLCLSCGGPL